MNIALASAAIMMAIGIFLLSAIEVFPTVDAMLGKGFALLLCLIAVVVYLLLFLRYGNWTAFQALNSHSLLVFTMGTWIARLAVLGNVLHKYFPTVLWFIQMIAFANSSLLIVFILIAAYHFSRLWREEGLAAVHGVVLLSTVSVQTVVILWQPTWDMPIFLAGLFILLGLVFDLSGILLIQIIIFTQAKLKCLFSHGG